MIDNRGEQPVEKTAVIIATFAAALAASVASAADIIRREVGQTYTYKVGDLVNWHFGWGAAGDGRTRYLTGIPSGTVIARGIDSAWLRGTLDKTGTWALEYHIPYQDHDGRDVEAVIEHRIVVVP